jgi:hypothetical protein
MNGKNKIYVLDERWILVGIPTDKWTLREAYVVRSWSNGRGIGALAKSEHKGEYTLDYIGGVEIRGERVVFTIPCEW